MKEIKINKCPDCGAGVKSESKRDQHTNGHWHETIVFGCGARHHFSPNFMRVDVQTGCPSSPERSARDSKRRTILSTLRDTIEKSDVDAVFCRLLLDKLRYVPVDS